MLFVHYLLVDFLLMKHHPIGNNVHVTHMFHANFMNLHNLQKFWMFQCMLMPKM